jgi:hypothetical protein
LPVIALAPATFAQPKHRGDVERGLAAAEAAHRATPEDSAARRTYGRLLIELGEMERAKAVFAPLATPSATNVPDLTAGGRLALLTGDYLRAESLFTRLGTLARADSARGAGRMAGGADSAALAAVDGLTMVYYQTNRFDRAKELTSAGQDEERGTGSLLTFMQRFEGTPYRIEWTSPERVAQLPIINDFAPAGALPILKVEVNGHPVELILDTGGDRLYLDEGVARRLGVREIAKRRSRYAYTQGQYVEEPLGVASTVRLGEVTLGNVPVIGATWKALGQTTDGVLTTQVLKPFLTTVDYRRARLTFRERSERGKRQLIESFGAEPPIRIPFIMAGTHLMFAKGSLNGRTGLNLLLDSGLAMSMPLVILEETVAFLGLPKNPVPNTKYYWSPLESHGLVGMVRGPAQALGNVLVEEDSYRRYGFLFDALVSHQYLRHLGSWTIDFDAMSYYFPAAAGRP